MKNEYLAMELCEKYFPGIDENTFRRNKKKTYIPQLEAMGFKVTEIKNGRGRHTLYILEKTEKTEQQKAKDEFLKIIGCETGKHDIDLLKLILKSILEKKIVPAHEELLNVARHAGIKNVKTETTIANYFNFLKKNKIILKPSEQPVWIYNPNVLPEYDKETGEILPTYYKKHVNWIYYDYADKGVGGFRKRLNKSAQNTIHEAYNLMCNEEYQRIIVPLEKAKVEKSIIAETRSKMQKRVLQEIGEAYGLNKCVRIKEPIINAEISKKLKMYFGLNEQKNREIVINVNDIELSDIKRSIHSEPSPIEDILSGKALINCRVKLCKEKTFAMPKSLYEKWHDEEEFQEMLDKPTLDLNDEIPDFNVIKNLERNNKINIASLTSSDTSEVADKQVVLEMKDFEKQLSAFIFKGEENTADEQQAFVNAMINKNKANKRRLQPWEE